MKRKVWIAGALGSVTVFGLASATFAQRDGREGGPVIRQAMPEVAVMGSTPFEIMDRHRRLHERLSEEIPDGLEQAVVSVELTDEDRAELARPHNMGVEPMRVGVVKSIRERVGVSRGQSLTGREKNVTGIFRRTEDDGYVWATTITSPGAVAIRVHFENFSLPDGAEAFFLSREGEAYGPYVANGPHGTGEFWSHSVASFTGIVLTRYSGPVGAEDLRNVSLRITEVGHVALDFPRPAGEGGIAAFCQYNADCVENASCVNEPAVDDAENAVAKMRWISGAFINICSGGLIADTDDSTQIPFFLTANHCLNKNKDARNLECFFQYSVPCGTSTCVGSFDPAPAPSTFGAQVVEAGSSGDFSLLQLDEDPPAGSVFLGWSTNPVAFTSGAELHRISHPSGAPQGYSQHAVDTEIGTCLNTPRGTFIYSDDVFGATEGGSSGSPVVNANGQIVGQLLGCCAVGGGNCSDVCHPNNHTIDGAFAEYFPSVEPFLDPDGGGADCASDADCDDGLFCNGAETCSSGTCVAGDDPCPGEGCDEATQSCVSCGGNRSPCTSDADCCSGNCRGGTCRGN